MVISRISTTRLAKYYFLVWLSRKQDYLSLFQTRNPSETHRISLEQIFNKILHRSHFAFLHYSKKWNANFDRLLFKLSSCDFFSDRIFFAILINGYSGLNLQQNEFNFYSLSRLPLGISELRLRRNFVSLDVNRASVHNACIFRYAMHLWPRSYGIADFYWKCRTSVHKARPVLTRRPCYDTIMFY